ncbi:PTERIN-4-ALPHA-CARBINOLAMINE DEHYDRATASE, partial [Salix koriyanagi]
MSTTASTTTLFPFSISPPKFYPPHNHHHFKVSILTPAITPTLRLQAMGAGDLGEFGARDPFPAEIESGFAEKVLGNVDTEHKILIPTVSALSLSQQEYTPISPLQDPMSKDDAQKLLRK